MAALKTRVPPPLVMLGGACLVWMAARLWPAAGFALPGRWLWCIALMLGGVAVVAAGLRECRRANTTVNPLRPEEASSLVTRGVFRVSRNPMYLGLFGILSSWALWESNAVGMLVPVLFVLYMNRFQIEPEERALRTRFGAAFEAYSTRVRRWL